ncbi:MAG: TetR/AcrR family transcriptional regulator [Treponema sp.]|nr:TetR/AcrR family transcriptional regulator [Treponema sp.]
MSSTKQRIIDAAINLFSKNSFDNVSMRDIAGEVGIKAASIYNHFSSKRDILNKLYELYTAGFYKIMPNVKELLLLLETEPIQNILPKLEFYWPPHLQDRMGRILLIATRRIHLDKESELFVQKHLFNALRGLWVPFLNRAIELGKIEPIDVDSFLYLITYYTFSSAELHFNTMMKSGIEDWKKVIAMIFSLLKPINN